MPKAFQQFRRGISLDQAVAAVGGEVLETIHTSRRPAHLDRFDPVAGPQPFAPSLQPGRRSSPAKKRVPSDVLSIVVTFLAPSWPGIVVAVDFVRSRTTYPSPMVASR